MSKYEQYRREVEIAVKMSKNMNEAAYLMDMTYRVFTTIARHLGVYYTTNEGKKKPGPKPGVGKIPTADILAGLYPDFQSRPLLNRLLDEGYKQHICEKCGITKWNGLPTPLELNHIDGDNKNHALENLEVLCPNCHAQDDNHRGRNKGRRWKQAMEAKKQEFLQACGF